MDPNLGQSNTQLWGISFLKIYTRSPADLQNLDFIDTYLLYGSPGYRHGRIF